MNTPSQSSPPQVIHCTNCAQDNLADRKFCGQCGAKLWEPCGSCNAINAVDEKFCGGCGANVADVFGKLKQTVHAKFAKAIQFEKDGYFHRADSLLRELTELDDKRFSEQKANALRMLPQLQERQAQRSAEAQVLWRKATAEHDARNFKQALQLVEQIPPGLRQDETRRLLEELQAIVREIGTLTQSIRDAIGRKEFDGLLPKVQRLRQLQPQNTEVGKLADKLTRREQDSAIRQARELAIVVQQKLDEHKYQQAAETAIRISPACREGKIGQVYRRARELCWYADQFKYATIATPALLQVGQRWQQASADDKRVTKSLELLEPRLRYVGKDPRLPHAPWKPAPEIPALGCHVKWWSGMSHVGVKGVAVRNELSRDGGRFMVAYGLALQGLGLGVLNHNIHPQRKGWGSLLTQRRGKNEGVWGVDIGATSLKAIHLTKSKLGDEVRIEDCLLIPHTSPLAMLADEDERSEAIAESVEQFLAKTAAKRPRVAVSFPSRRALARFFDLPPLSGKRIQDVITYEIRHQIPMDVEHAVFDYHAWPSDGETIELHSVAVVAAHRAELEKWVSPIVAAGCDVALVQCDAFALYNAVHREFLNEDSGEAASALAVLDVGGDASNLLLAEKNYAWFRSIVHGTQRWDVAISRELNLTREQAEKVRFNPHRARWMHQLDDVLCAEFQQLHGEISRTLEAYPRREDAETKLLLGVGGGFHQFGLLRYLNHGAVPSNAV